MRRGGKTERIRYDKFVAAKLTPVSPRRTNSQFNKGRGEGVFEKAFQ